MLTHLLIPESEVEVSAMRAQGAGGQNVNKVSSAIHLRFHIPHSSLPADVKVRLLALKDSRITRDGAIVIKAQSHRSQELNRADAFERLHVLVNSVAGPLRRGMPPNRPLARACVDWTRNANTRKLRRYVENPSCK